MISSITQVLLLCVHALPTLQQLRDVALLRGSSSQARRGSACRQEPEEVSSNLLDGLVAADGVVYTCWNAMLRPERLRAQCVELHTALRSFAAVIAHAYLTNCMLAWTALVC